MEIKNEPLEQYKHLRNTLLNYYDQTKLAAIGYLYRSKRISKYELPFVFGDGLINAILELIMELEIHCVKEDDITRPKVLDETDMALKYENGLWY
jgi:hypothetical protein